MDDQDLRCPVCRALDWHRDGFAMRELANGAVVRERVAPSVDVLTPWSCARCAYEVPDAVALRHSLTEAATAHVE